ncbi:hypothetical protein HZC30_03845 [Candidatus Woesearchaeota archaeon]|nr:hypothetical protein [Candidatus Woesearchaeota archaeon]
MPKDVYEEYLETHTLDEILKGETDKPAANLIAPTNPIVPTNLSSAESKLYGVLFSDRTLMLKYFDLESKKIQLLAESSESISSLLATDDEVYFGTTLPASVTALFRASTQRYPDVLVGMHHWQGRLLVYGTMGIIDAQKNLDLIPEAQFPKKFEQVSSLHTDSEGNLLALLWLKRGSFFSGGEYYLGELRQINGSEGDYRFGKKVLKKDYFAYSIERMPKIEILPTGKPLGVGGESSAPSRLSYSYYNYTRLCLDDQSVAGLRDEISCFKLFRCTEREAEILYSASAEQAHQLLTAKIDIKKKVVLDREVVMDKLLHPAHVLVPVTHYPLHQKLLERGHQHEYNPI